MQMVMFWETVQMIAAATLMATLFTFRTLLSGRAVPARGSDCCLPPRAFREASFLFSSRLIPSLVVVERRRVTMASLVERLR